jgi:hypothetical protein
MNKYTGIDLHGNRIMSIFSSVRSSIMNVNKSLLYLISPIGIPSVASAIVRICLTAPVGVFYVMGEDHA